MIRVLSLFAVVLALGDLSVLARNLPELAGPQDLASLNGSENFTDGATVDILSELINPSTAQPVSGEEFKATAVTQSSTSRARGGRAKSVTSIADVAGEYVMTYNTLLSSGNDGGKGVAISQIEGTDSILITNFWDTGISVKACVDISSLTFTIPNQVVGNSSTYGDYDLAYCKSDGSPDRSLTIDGTISADGTLTITSWWGVFIVSGTYADAYYGLYSSAQIMPANSTMSYQTYSTSTGSYSTTTFNVIVNQSGGNVVDVINFGNFGQTVSIVLKADSTATIAKQVARADATNGDWYVYSVTYKTDYSGLTYTSPVVCDAATDDRSITWGAWNMICTSYYYAIITSGRIDSGIGITYPASSTSLTGTGTANDPYLITSAGDLMFLSDEVNGNDDYSYSNGSTSYSITYSGKYFRLENDIDLSGYSLTPIGDDYYHHFGGVFDGNGKTITSLSVSTSGNGFAGLFGRCDSTSVIKNLTLAAPVVETSGYYAGGIAAYTDGSIENCHVIEGEITNSYYTGTGGISAYAYNITGCTVTSSTITGAGGFTGGISGQINGKVSDCSVTNTTIVTSGLDWGYPAGGIVGSLYYGTATQCYFAGTLDGTALYNLYLGGITGGCYYGSVSHCYNTGTIKGSNVALVGGIAGCLKGSVDNCYSTGRAESTLSVYVGGIAGYIDEYTLNDVTVQSSVTNCYSATSMQSYVYDYDVSTECREILGTIADGCTPSFANLYFDNQVVNYGSAQYGVTTAELTSGSPLDGLDSGTWTYTQGYYPRLAGMDETEAAKLSASVVEMSDNSSYSSVARNGKLSLLGQTEAKFLADGSYATAGHYAHISGDSLIIGSEIGTDTLCLVNSAAGVRYCVLSIFPSPFDGAGTAQSPYLIQTKQDLIDLADLATNSGQDFTGTHFLMTADIDLELDTAFVGICNGDNIFSGNFNGGGYTIHRMRLPDHVVWTTSPDAASDGYGTPSSGTSYTGFVGTLSSAGTLRNLTIAADCQLTGQWSVAGSLVGYNCGQVDSCQNFATVSTYSSWAGGIVGYNYPTGQIADCLNAGDVICGSMYAGGIAGTNCGLIERCQNSGDVSAQKLSTLADGSALNYAGGIAGITIGARYSDCVNLGTVSCYDYAGGICGTLDSSVASVCLYTNDLINCINYGSIFTLAGSDNVGEMGGSSGTTGVINNNFYDGQTTLHRAHGDMSLEGVTAATTATFTSGAAIDGFSADTWDFSAGLYPTLKSFTTDSATIAKRSIILTIASDEDVSNLLTDVALSSGCEWSLKVGGAFSIDSGMLIVPKSVTQLTADTLVATMGDYSKAIIVHSAPIIPLSGEGTAESPYIISNVDDWNNLASYMTASQNDLTEQYVKLASDLDFTDTTLSSISSDRVTVFNGDFNGNGLTVKGFTATADASYFGPLFTATGDRSAIHDLTVEGEVTSAKTYTGGVVGELSGLLSNIVSRVTLSTTKSYAGGMVAIARSGASITDCVFEGSTSSSGTYSAGLVGYSETGVKYESCGNRGSVSYTGSASRSYTAGMIGCCYPDTIIDCFNSGIISATNSSAGGLGGLIGIANAASSSTKYYIKGCSNTANISSNSSNAGLIMTLNASGYTKIYMEDCHNSGDITSTSTTDQSSTATVGICGFYSKSSTFANCTNTGKITSSAASRVGGIIGGYKGTLTSSTRTYITGCYNYGEICAAGGTGGGIVGYCTDYLTIDSCANSANISGGSGIGGIAGAFLGDASIMQNCWNGGAVAGTSTRVGGLVGYNNKQSEITCCANFGDVSSADLGVGGIAGQGGSIFTNVYNAGSVSGTGRVGGLVGYPVQDKTIINGSYNSGTVTATDSCGMIIGIKMTKANECWGESNSVSATYYLSENEVASHTDTVGTAITRAALAALDMGDDWTDGDDYTYPRITSIADNDYAQAYAAAVIPAEGDSYDSITGAFHIGCPDNVTWVANNEEVTINGNDVTIPDGYTGSLAMTATAGEIAVTTNLTCAAGSGGISGLENDCRTIISEKLYTVSGIQVAEPTDGPKAIHIVVRTYSDGTIETLKEVK